MKKTRRRSTTQNTYRAHDSDQKLTEAADDARPATTSGDLMWGDEGIDDPPELTPSSVS